MILSKITLIELARNSAILGEDFLPKNFKGCSYDLRLGTVFRTSEIEDKIISVKRKQSPQEDPLIIINPSEIVTMLTHEVVNLPNNVCATVFPINKLSSRGLLILNPGHIDPGYKGPLALCAINLSNEAITLRLKSDIFTIIFSKLDKETDAYQNNIYDEDDRIGYESKYYIEKASKLSSSIFDIFTINKYVPHLRQQISIVLKERWNKIISIIFYILIGLATIFSLVYISMKDIGKFFDRLF